MAGRKPKPESEVRENVLRVRLTEEERALLDAAAQEKGLETSKWVRVEMLALAKKSLKDREQ